jgi:hypothetical protein
MDRGAISKYTIVLTEINNKAHYVAKKNKKAKNKATPPPKKTLQKQAKTAPIGFALSV